MTRQIDDDDGFTAHEGDYITGNAIPLLKPPEMCCCLTPKSLHFVAVFCFN